MPTINRVNSLVLVLSGTTVCAFFMGFWALFISRGLDSSFYQRYSTRAVDLLCGIELPKQLLP